MRAQSQAVELPVSAQITSTKGFIEREKKRLVAAEEAVKALAQGEVRLEVLQLQEKSPFTRRILGSPQSFKEELDQV